jgi:IS1 family transposase
MNRLSREQRTQIISLLVEGMSLRAITRTTGVSINTVTKLLIDAGRACSAYQDRHLRGLKSQRIQVDEIWAFTYAKAKNVPTAKAAPIEAGDIWTWVAIDADTKLVPSWFVGDRSAVAARHFMLDIKDRIDTRIQLTSDAFRSYAEVVESVFGRKVDYAQLVKTYATPSPEPQAARRYSPTECIAVEKRQLIGVPDLRDISTSFVERQNLTMRMHMRRFTRLTNAFSKKAVNHVHAVSLHFMYYNFCRIHQTLRITPAMAAGVTGRLWEVEDIVRTVEQWETKTIQNP